MKFFSLIKFFVPLVSFLELPASAEILSGKNASEKISGAEKLVIDDSLKTVSFIKLQDAFFVSASSPVQWLKESVLNTSAETDFKITRQEKDESGFTHCRYKQYQNGIPVEYGVYFVHEKNGRIISANGEYYDNIPSFSSPAIDSAATFGIAKKSIGVKKMQADVHANYTDALVILPFGGTYHLCFKCDVYSEIPFGRWWVYVDAISSEVIKKETRIESADANARAVTRYYGIKQMTTDSVAPIVFKMRETGRGNGIRTYNMNFGTVYGTSAEYNDADNYWNATTLDNAAYDAHWSAEKTYDFYLSKFNRNSFDDNGGEILNYTHYSVGLVNAFWDGTKMTYGDGDQINYDPFTSTEIVGHEITHAVTQHTAGLVYSGESGALNEAVSDVMGTAINNYANPSTAGWLFGDRIALAGSPFRNLSDPNMYGQPDTYHGSFWDYAGDVHVNSGVGNYWYYLLSNGGNGTNDNGNNFSMNGIGIDDATKIIYRALTVYFTPNCNYNNARTYSIQAALDLFGTCSNQVVQCTNAWYAVGVGSVFNNATSISFTATPLNNCGTPSSVSFTSSSTNVTSYLWDFGDGTTDTAQNPVHLYATLGNFTVTVIGADSTFCNGIDTFSRQTYVSVTASPLAAASCTPATLSYCCNAGIYSVQFGSINNISGNASEGYRDYSCYSKDTMVLGDFETLLVSANSNSSLQKLNCWIDYNNDGTYADSTEWVYHSSGQENYVNRIIYTSPGAVTNTPLRMRVMQSISSSPVTSACQNVDTGQVEDYAVMFVLNSQPPPADFVANTVSVNPGAVVQFSDRSHGLPTSWQWNFSGGTPATSTDQNPIVQYLLPGSYSVTLYATNAFGTTTKYRSSYINVSSNFYSCVGLSQTAAPSGILYNSSSTNPDSCFFLITPDCAKAIQFTFLSLDIEPGDTLFIFDGPTTSDSALVKATGYTTLAPLTTSSGDALILFKKTTYITYYSYRLRVQWSKVTANSQQPTANFSFSPNNVPLYSQVHFTNLSSTNAIDWHWNFYDGDTSNYKNPVHGFSVSGTDTVTLVAYSCYLSDTTMQVVTVQNPPQSVIVSNQVNVSLTCNDSLSVFIKLKNIAGGDFTLSSGGLPSSPLNILVYTSRSGLGLESIQQVSAIRQFYSNFNLSSILTSSSAQLDSALIGKDIFLVPWIDNGELLNFSLLAPAIKKFAENGGVVMLCSDSYFKSYSSVASGLFEGDYLGQYLPHTIQNADTAHPITDNVSLFFGTNGNTYQMNFFNEDEHPLITDVGDVVSLRKFGRGYAIYFGYDYSTYDINMSRLISNAVKWVNDSIRTQWVNCNPVSEIIQAGDSVMLDLHFSTEQMIAGRYYDTLRITTNDTSHRYLSIPVSLTVHGSSEISVQDTCISFTSFQFGSETHELVISNNGCDTLFIDSISNFTSQFSVAGFPGFILPLNSVVVSVNFNPLVIGTQNDTLKIYDSDHDVSVCLYGIAISPPSESVSSHFLQATLNGCYDSTTVLDTIFNSGASVNSFTVHGGGLSDTTNVLVFAYGVTPPSDLDAVVNSINYPHSVSIFSSTNFYALENELKTTDVVIVPKLSIPDSIIYGHFAAPLQSFVSSGGTVIFCGPDTSCIGNINATGLLNLSWARSVSGQFMHVADSTTPLTDSVPTYSRSIAFNSFHIADTGSVTVIKYFQDDIVSYRNYGAGKIIFIAGEYNQFDSLSSTILNNAVRWAHDENFPHWLKISPESGNISPGSYNVLTVKFISDRLAGGQHQTQFYIHSADPLHPVDSVACTLNSRQLPCVSFAASVSPCSGAVQFQNTSTNHPFSFFWDFADGSTDTIENPLHLYLSPGSYIVKFISCNSFGCDTIEQEVVVVNYNGLAPITCTPATISYCCYFGIYRVILNDLDVSSTYASEGYQDRTCLYSTQLYTYGTYLLDVVTDATYPEDVFAWIDYNSDGFFDPVEQIMIDTNHIQYHSGLFTVPVNAVYNTPLRLRVGSEYSNHNFLTGCSNPFRGQYEDYTVVVASGLIDEIQVADIFRNMIIYPNPFSSSSILEFTLNENEKISVEVFNLVGEKIKSLASGKIILKGKSSILINDLDPGIYFVKVNAGNFQRVLKIVSLQ